MSRPKFQRAVCAAVFLIWLPSLLPAATIILVRHAERGSAMTSDVPISPAGEERARALAQVLKNAGIQRIYVTALLRTQQTAAPIAARLHLQPIVIAPDDTDALLSQLRALKEDETALVVGHSNTVPLIVERLGGGKVTPIADAEYDRLIVVVTSPTGKAKIVTLRYWKSTE